MNIKEGLKYSSYSKIIIQFHIQIEALFPGATVDSYMDELK